MSAHRCPLCDLGRRLAHEYAGRNLNEPCEHGHLGCAEVEGGPCVDEVLTRHEAADPDCEECDR